MEKNYSLSNKKSNVFTFFFLLSIVLLKSQTVQTFTYTGVIQTFTVPTCVYTMTIQAKGAEGGYYVGQSTMAAGLGADMKGVFAVTPGQVLKILVGQQPSLMTLGNGGGGGSFVTDISNNPLIVAGGGGGSSQGPDSPNKHGQVGTAGGLGSGGGGTGGINGNGGNVGASFAAGAGGGLLTDGQTGWTASTAGIAFVNGGAGASSPAMGGFGGGGSGSAYIVGGGGGGYSGGGGGSNSNGIGVGGGGGSFNGGTNQVNVGGSNVGHGTVTFSFSPGSPVTAFSTPAVICSGATATLSASGVTSYTWLPSNSNATSITVNPTTNTNYTVVGINATGCTTSVVVTVPVNSALPVLTVTNTANTICLGKTATLTAGGAVSYTWTGGPGGVLNGQTFTPTATSGYTVTGQNGCGQSTASTTITIAPLAVSVASSSNNICSGSPAILTATAAVNGFTWMPGNLTGTNVTVSPLVNTVYTLTASDGTCSGVATLSLTTKPIPTLAIVASATNICEGALVTMTVSGAQTYSWVSPSSNATSISANPTVATSYIVSGTNLSNCISATSQIIVTKPNPVVNVATNKPIVCEAGSATLIASGGAASYSWVNGPATNSNVVNPIVNSTYTVTGTGANACTTDKTITINVLSVSVAVSSASTTICSGKSTIINASGASTYTWVGQGNFASATVSPTITTTYSVNANTTSQGLTCPSSNSITIIVNALPTVSVSATKTFVCRRDANVIITASGASTYSWSPTQITSTISVHPQTTTTYSVMGTDANGCEDAASLQIVVSPCTGVEEFTGSEKTISVYPNPSNGELTISCESDITLKVINELGQAIQAIHLNQQNDHKVVLSNLTNGVYFIVGQNNIEKVNQKIVVNK